MACNCKVSQNIDYLHKKYGDKVPQSKITNIRGKVEVGVKNFLLYLMTLPLLPLMAVFALVKLGKGEVIHLDKVVKKA